MNRAKVINTLTQIRTLVDDILDEVGAGHRGSARRTTSSSRSQVGVPELSFNMNVLAFMNKYARGVKGPQKFPLLLARLTKGKTSQQVSKAEAESNWNKMRVVLGGKFNPAHTNRAKAKGWVDSPRHGQYTLSESWKECLPKK